MIQEKKGQRAKLTFTLSPVEQAEVLKLDFSIAELKKQFTISDFAKDHDTSLTLDQGVILPHDVADLAMEGLEETQDLLVMK